jgi:hypothetical protein
MPSDSFIIPLHEQLCGQMQHPLRPRGCLRSSYGIGPASAVAARKIAPGEPVHRWTFRPVGGSNRLQTLGEAVASEDVQKSLKLLAWRYPSRIRPQSRRSYWPNGHRSRTPRPVGSYGTVLPTATACSIAFGRMSSIRRAQGHHSPQLAGAHRLLSPFLVPFFEPPGECIATDPEDATDCPF